MPGKSEGIKIVASNKRARRDFLIEDTYEAGIALVGTEVKSLRSGQCTLTDGYARPRGNELFLFDVHIPPYEQGTVYNHEPKRPRKLLLHRRELDRILAQCAQRGQTLVPLRLYFKEGKAKVEIGLARRRRHWDKREKKAAEQRRQDAQADLARRRGR